MILAIDTSTDEAGVALLDGGSLRAECNWLARDNHSRQLTRVMRMMLDIQETPVSTISAVAVAVGPGSFNGLRVGVSAAKGIVTALRVPLIGVSTLDIIGFQASVQGATVWALIPAGRGEMFRAAYDGVGETWRRISPYGRLAVAQAAAEWSEDILLAGPAARLLVDQLGREGRTASLQEPAKRMRRAGYLAELGRRGLAAGEAGSVGEVQPMYLRRSSAEEKREARSDD